MSLKRDNLDVDIKLNRNDTWVSPAEVNVANLGMVLINEMEMVNHEKPEDTPTKTVYDMLTSLEILPNNSFTAINNLLTPPAPSSSAFSLTDWGLAEDFLEVNGINKLCFDFMQEDRKIETLRCYL